MSRLVGGAILVLVGLLLALANFRVIGPVSAGDFWPMVLIWLGATRLLAPPRSAHFASGAVLLALGVFFQVDRLGWLDLSFEDFWPYLLVAAGAAMIFDGVREKRAPIGPVDGAPTGGRS
jgi:hypothetical protein